MRLEACNKPVKPSENTSQIENPHQQRQYGQMLGNIENMVLVLTVIRGILVGDALGDLKKT